METVDVRELPPHERHPVIFDCFDQLEPNEVMEVVNDHDPQPLYFQFMAEFPGRASWEYVEQGPEMWRVRIAKLSR